MRIDAAMAVASVASAGIGRIADPAPVAGAADVTSAGGTKGSAMRADANNAEISSAATPPSGVSALAGATGIAGAAAPRPAAVHSTASADSVAAPRDLSDPADRLMNQVVQTVRAFESSGRPGLEARVHDPELGDVRLVVAGRAGEVVQAELIVRDRATADALSHAALRLHNTEALAGVNVTVRSEGGSSAGGRWSGDSDSSGWAQSGGHGAAGHGTGSGAGAGSGSSAGTNQSDGRTAAQLPFDGGRTDRPRPEHVRPVAPIAPRQTGRSRLGGQSLDIRA